MMIPLGLGFRNFLILCLLALPGVFANATEPFEELDNMTKNEIRWAGSKSELARAFNSERDRLGNEFQNRLLKFVDKSPERHYWCGCFLTTDDYLGKHEPNHLLAVALWEQGILLATTKDKGEPCRPFHYLLAIEYSRLDFQTLAAHHKACSEYLLREFGEGGPATSMDDMKIYDAIEPLASTFAGQSSPATLPIGRYKIVEGVDKDKKMLFDTTTGKLWDDENGVWVLRVHPPQR